MMTINGFNPFSFPGILVTIGIILLIIAIILIIIAYATTNKPVIEDESDDYAEPNGKQVNKKPVIKEEQISKENKNETNNIKTNKSENISNKKIESNTEDDEDIELL